MRRTIIAAGSFALLLGSATAATAAPPGSDPVDHTVVVGGLDNPRQLSWSGRTLLIAESGEGGEDCAPAPADDTATDDPTADDTATTDDDGTADQGSGDTATDDTTATDVPSTDDDGTADQGSGDTPVPTDPTADTPAADTAAADEAAAAAVEVCEGPTGGIAGVERPGRVEEGEAEAVVEGLYSVESPEGSVGPAGVAATDRDDVLLIAQGELSPDALAADTDDALTATQEYLLVSNDGEVRPWIDLGQEEADQDPDGNGIADSNPNAVLFVDPDDSDDSDPDDSSDDGAGDSDDAYALVADAGANAVWKVTADFDALREDELPEYEVSVFAAFPADPEDPDAPQFVPSTLTQDPDGNVYVGGVGGGLTPGGAEVVRFDADGEETGRWGGFTAINGIAVSPNGEHVYVSQVFGSEGPAGGGTGSVIRFETEDSDDASYVEADVPFPAGLALGGNSAVYVAAYSLSPADADDPTTEDAEGGQLWRFLFPEDAEEQLLPVVDAPATDPADDTTTDPAPADDGTGLPDDDGTADQGSGDTAVDDGTALPDDDGTADQGSGDAPVDVVPGDDPGVPADDPVITDDGTLDQGPGDVVTP
ncbi:ScyD/ScyE family protein [Geodermatophilus sp. SYSU D00703]